MTAANEPRPTSAPAADANIALRRFVYSDQRLRVIVILSLFVFVVLLWLPFGFKTTGLMEEWMIIHDWENGGHSEQGQDVALFITSGTLAMRPMDSTVFILAHELSPASFLGYNLYTMLTFFLKGLLLYAILLKLLPDNPLFAFSAALLFVIFPADDGLFTFRGMNIHTALWLYLFAVYLLLSYYEKPRLVKLFPMWGALLVSLFAYELSHPLIAVTPAVLLWKERRVSRRLIRVSALWWFAPLVAFVYAAFMFTRGETYQSWVLARSGLNRVDVVGEIAASIGMAYRRHFGEGWTSGLQSLTPRLLPYALATCAAAGATLSVQLPLARRSVPASYRRYVELFLIGIGIIFISYGVYMITPYRQLTWRVFYFSGIGGAISVTCLVYLLARLFKPRQIVFAVAMSALIGLAAVRALDQHQYYVGLSAQQQQLLRGIARAVPAFKASATMVVIDETGRYRDNWSLGTGYLVEDAFGYLYDDYSLQAVLCYFDPQRSAFGILPELREQCQFAPNELRVFEDGKQVEALPYDQVVVVRVADDGVTLLDSIPPQYLDSNGAEAYDPAALVDPAAPPPPRYHTMFSLPD